MDFKPDPNWKAKVLKDAKQRLDRGAALISNQAKQTLSRGRRGAIGDLHSVIGAGEPPHVASGRLRQSIWTRTPYGRDLVRQIGTSTFYGLVQEVGAPGTGLDGESVGPVVPRHGKYLAIPLSQEAVNYRSNGGSARSFQPKSGRRLRRVPLTKTEGFLLVEESPGRGKKRMGAKSVIHYLFVTKVVIPKHPWLMPSFEAVKPAVMALFEGGHG